jgi:hypothetical protein
MLTTRGWIRLRAPNGVNCGCAVAHELWRAVWEPPTAQNPTFRYVQLVWTLQRLSSSIHWHAAVRGVGEHTEIWAHPLDQSAPAAHTSSRPAHWAYNTWNPPRWELSGRSRGLRGPAPAAKASGAGACVGVLYLLSPMRVG